MARALGQNRDAEKDKMDSVLRCCYRELKFAKLSRYSHSESFGIGTK